MLPFSPYVFMHINGIMEIIIGTLLLIGLFTRIISGIAAFYMSGVMAAVGYNDIAIRDFAIFSALIALLLSKDYYLSFDNKLTSEEKEWLIRGSVDEDTPPRWINHFYDPIYQQGWTGQYTGWLPE